MLAEVELAKTKNGKIYFANFRITGRHFLSLPAIVILIFVHLCSYGQDQVDDNLQGDQLEDLSADDEDVADNDFDAQQLYFFRNHPLDINGDDLDQLPQLSQVNISSLKKYRSVLGNIVDLYELQAVPGFTHNLIRSIMPFVTVKKEQASIVNIKQRFTDGNYNWLTRPVLTPEKADGFKSSSGQQFTGSRVSMLTRFKYQCRDLLQYGVIAEKDAGEPFVTKGMLPDFLSFHLFARRLGIIKAIAFGDYTVNMGQGLMQWQSQAFRKSSSVINIKRQSPVLRPYSSAGEHNFNRGIAFTAGKHGLECTSFYSSRKITANIVDGSITSINTSGLHRTKSEIHDKHAASVNTIGMNIKRSMKHGHAGLSFVNLTYSMPVNKRDELYNVFSWKGKSWSNCGADYSLTLNNGHFFGEAAVDRQLSFAFINGLLSSLSKGLDLAILIRHIERSYQTVNGNAFTENTLPGNETGIYAGFSLTPGVSWKADLYADLFSFPWLKYRVDAPATGAAYLVQITYKPNRQTECYSRFRYRMKPFNIEDEEDIHKETGMQVIQQWRTQFSYRLSRSIHIRSRFETNRFHHALLLQSQSGYLFFTDLLYKASRRSVSGNLRFQAFECDGYESRVYAFENDLQFVSSIPAYYNAGIRGYLNLTTKIAIKRLSGSVLTTNLKAATTIYKNLSQVGSGPTGIAGNRVSTIKLQFFLSH